MNSTATVVDLSAWTAKGIRMPRLPNSFTGIMSKVRPLFASWMKADMAFEKNTKVVGIAVREAYDLYMKENPNGTRVAFARHFDETIAEDAKTRDLADNATYNRLNYMIDKVGKPQEEGDDETENTRVPVAEKRKHMHADWVSFRRRFKAKTIVIGDVEKLLTEVLTEIWTEEAVKEVLAA